VVGHGTDELDDAANIASAAPCSAGCRVNSLLGGRLGLVRRGQGCDPAIGDTPEQVEHSWACRAEPDADGMGGRGPRLHIPQLVLLTGEADGPAGDPQSTKDRDGFVDSGDDLPRGEARPPEAGDLWPMGSAAETEL
jgi:hypothetical protein